MKFQHLSEFDTDTLIHEMEVRGYWSIPKWHVKKMCASHRMEAEAVLAEPKEYRTLCADSVAVRMGRFLLETDMIKLTETQVGSYGMGRELIGVVHVLTDMPRALLWASSDAPLNSEGE